MLVVGIEKVCYPKLSTQREMLVSCILCLHRPVVFGICSYPWGKKILTSLLNARKPDPFNPYMPLRILR